jgi:hypothetical protein
MDRKRKIDHVNSLQGSGRAHPLDKPEGWVFTSDWLLALRLTACVLLNPGARP